jgi:cell wall-associated NlpC family hydrolase
MSAPGHVGIVIGGGMMIDAPMARGHRRRLEGGR